LQAKFLSVLEDRTVTRLGSDKTKKVDVRLISATNRDLKEAVDQGRFREDLYFRLNVFPIHIPPLRKRPKDIMPLMNHFLSVFSARSGRTPPELSAKARALVTRHRWPGNVRQLQNTAERALILAGHGAVEPQHLGLEPDETDADGARSTAGATLKEMEKQAIVDALAAAGGNRKNAAKQLGIALRTLQYKIKEYGIR
jgi:DNA-binding NtrC family response regulator